MLVTTGISSSVAPLTNHVGMGSREQPFVGDLAMIIVNIYNHGINVYMVDRFLEYMFYIRF